MQRGQIYRHNGSWLLRYWDITTTGRTRRAVKLAPVGNEYPTKRSVLLLAEKILAPINAGQVQPESSLSVKDFIEVHYFSHVEKELRPATLKNYKDLYRYHLKDRLNGIRLRDFRTVHGQRIMREIDGVGHTTKLRIKSLLSGVFKHALREGFLDGVNPIQNVSVPGRPERFEGPTYTLAEIEEISEVIARVDLTAFTAIAVAAFAGLRQSEICGLRWSDYDGNSLQVSRSVWRTHVGPTKTPRSSGTVPVLPILKKVLDEHHARTGGQGDQYIFAGERRGTPLNLNNLSRRVIAPALARHEGALLQWKGWHAFRRSLASNLYACGVSPKIIQAILRQSDIGTTLAYYVKTDDAEARQALQKIEDLLQAV